MYFRRRMGLSACFFLLSAALFAGQTPSYAPNEVLVRFRPSASAQATALGTQSISSLSSSAAAALRSVGARSADPLGTRSISSALSAMSVDGFEPLSRTYRVILPAGADVPAAVAALSANPAVEIAEPNARLALSQTANDTYYGAQWALKNTGQIGIGDSYDPASAGTPGDDIDAEAAWNVTTGDPALIVAVIDSGVDYSHPDLAANVWTNAAESGGSGGVDDDHNGYTDDVHGWDFGDSDNSPADNCGNLSLGEGHGTHVAGIIAAQGNNGAGVSGVTWDTKIMPLKVANTGCLINTSDVIQAIQYATANGARVINMSLGGSDSSSFHTACDAARSAGVTLVAAAGNNGQTTTPTAPLYPAGYSSVISVAATDRRDARASFSSYGSWVKLAAPGVAIRSTYPTADGSYAYLSGTSMASPVVAGIAALVLSQYPSLTPDQVEDRLEKSCEVIGASGVGSGRINAARALLDFTGVSPQIATAGVPQTIALTGTSFQSGMTVQLTRGGFPTVTATSVSVSDHQHATCQVNVPAASTGLWNIQVVMGQTVAVAPETILFEGVQITGASPNVWPATAVTGPIILSGQKFGSNLTASLERIGYPSIPAATLTVLTSTAAVATFDVTGAAGGRWDVVVSSGGATSVLSRGLAVTTALYQVVSPPVSSTAQYIVPIPQGSLVLDWPAGAYPTPIQIDIDAAPSLPPLDRNRDPYAPTGIGVTLEVVGGPSLFDQPFRLTLPYRAMDLADANKDEALTLAYFNTNTRRWQPIGDSTVNSGLRTVSATAAHFSSFQLVQHVPSTNLDSVIAYPNPFRPDRGNDRIVFDFLPAGATLKIFDLAGKLVRELSDDDGDGRVDWIGVTNDDGEKLASGVYLYVASSGGKTKTGRVAVLR